MKAIRILFLLALMFWIIAASAIAFGNAETFGFSWMMQSAGLVVSGWLLILISSRKYFSQIKLAALSKLLILLVVFCFYLVLPAATIVGWIANLAGIGDFISKPEIIRSLGLPLLLYILLMDTINIVLAVSICVGLTLLILNMVAILKSSKPTGLKQFDAAND